MKHIVNKASDLSQCELIALQNINPERVEVIDARNSDDSFGTIGWFSDENQASEYVRKHGGKL